MKKQLLSLFLLFGFLTVMSVVFPYEHPCETDRQEQTILDAKKTTNLAKYTGVEAGQVARLESGEIYDFDANSTPYDNVQIEADLPKEKPCINCEVTIERADFLDQLESAAFARMRQADLYKYKPPSMDWGKRWSNRPRARTQP